MVAHQRPEVLGQRADCASSGARSSSSRATSLRRISLRRISLRRISLGALILGAVLVSEAPRAQASILWRNLGGLLGSDAASEGPARPLSITHHGHGYRVSARCAPPPLPGAWILLVEDLDPASVSGLVDDVAPTAAALLLPGLTPIRFQEWGPGELGLLVPASALVAGADAEVVVYSGERTIGSVGVAGMLP